MVSPSKDTELPKRSLAAASGAVSLAIWSYVAPPSLVLKSRQTPGPPLFHWLGLEGHCEGGPKRAALREALNRRGRK